MKKTKKYIFIFLFLFFVVAIIATINQTRYNGKYGCIRRIEYNNETYDEWLEISEYYIASGIVDDWTMYPYILVDNYFWDDYAKKVYVSKNNIFTDLRYPHEYIVVSNKTFDEKTNFLIETPDDMDRLFVKTGFVFPDTRKSKIDEIWLSLAPDDETHIKDSAVVNKIVECAKSDGKIELDKEIYNYIEKNSYNNNCILLKYEGYPLVEEFYVEKTKDGKCFVKQERDTQSD